MPRVGARAAGQQAEAVVEPVADLLGGKQFEERRGQLERQRNAVEPAADFGDRRRVVRADGELGRDLARTVDEEAHRLVGQQRLRVVRDTLRRDRQRTHRDHPLSRQAEPLAARRQHAQRRRGRQQPLGQRRGRGEDVLAVVEHQQHPARTAVADQRLGDGRVALFANAEARRDGARDTLGFRHRRQVDEPDAVREGGRHALGELDREPRLAAPPDAGQGDEPGFAEPFLQLREIVLAAHEACERLRQVVPLFRRHRHRHRERLDRDREAVPVARHRRDRVLAHGPAQCRDVDVKVALLDDASRPYPLEQLVLRDEAPGVRDERREEVERARLEGHEDAVAQEPPFAGLQEEGAEPVVARVPVAGHAASGRRGPRGSGRWPAPASGIPRIS